MSPPARFRRGLFKCLYSWYCHSRTLKKRQIGTLGRHTHLFIAIRGNSTGERAGSGVDKIMTAWEEQGWKKPVYDINVKAERVTLQLEVGQVVYISEAADLRKERFYNRIQAYASYHPAMEKEQVIIEYIKEHGNISMMEATEIC